MLKCVWVSVITIKYRRYLSACAKMLGSLVAKSYCIGWFYLRWFKTTLHQMALEGTKLWDCFARISLILMEFRLFFSGFTLRMVLEHFKVDHNTFLWAEKIARKKSINSSAEKAYIEWGFKAFKIVDWLNKVIRNWIVFAFSQSYVENLFHKRKESFYYCFRHITEMC